MGTRKNRRARRRRAHPFSLSPTTSKRLLRRLSLYVNFASTDVGTARLSSDSTRFACFQSFALSCAISQCARVHVSHWLVTLTEQGGKNTTLCPMAHPRMHGHVIVWKCPPSPGLWSFSKTLCFIFSHVTGTFVQTSRSRNTAAVTSNTGAVGNREFRCHHTACALLCLFMFVCIMYLLELYI